MEAFDRTHLVVAYAGKKPGIQKKNKITWPQFRYAYV